MINNFPKIIHQIYGFWDKKIPSNIQNRIDTWKKLHPDYEYILWDKKKSREFIKNNYEWFLRLYDGYDYNVQRTDALRYFLLYHYGGIYSDIDLEPAKSLNTLLKKHCNKKCKLYKSSNSDLLTNDFMISKPKNIFWKKIFNELILNYNFSSLSKHLTVMYTTGPLLLDNAYEKFKKKKKNIYIINTKYINNCDISIPKPAKNKEAYLIRYDGNSWHGIDSTIINFFYKNYIIILVIILTFILFKIF